MNIAKSSTGCRAKRTMQTQIGCAFLISLSGLEFVLLTRHFDDTLLTRMIIHTSKATEYNWQRLGASNDGSRLRTRANKTLSTKFVTPEENICESINLPKIQELVKYIIDNAIPPNKALYSIAVNLLMKQVNNPLGVNSFTKKYGQSGIDEELRNTELPLTELDLLGVVYQMITPEGIRNMKGQYYTPRSIAKMAICDTLPLMSGYVLDPCCGSGCFLCESRVNDPRQLLGIDIDPIAVMITAANIMLKYPDVSFEPQVMCGNFIDGDLFNPVYQWLQNFSNQIEAIFTNPPWGALNNGKEGESFSLFIRESLKIIKERGSLRFILPESFGKIKIHAEIRQHFLKRAVVQRIEYIPPIFSGVVTSCLIISAQKGHERENKFIITKNGISQEVLQETILNSDSAFFIAQDSCTSEIITKVKERGGYTLSNSTWALGIVTGDNKRKISAQCLGADWKPICTGKDVLPYHLKPASSYVRYVRKELQQVAKEEIYNAPEKLVYKFISNSLCFSYDNSNVLFLNSANILIPNIEGMCIKTVLGFLNSDLYKFLYASLFDDIKILKGNLCSLPFPSVSAQEDRYISDCVDSILKGDSTTHETLQSYIFSLFDLSSSHINFIKKTIHGNN